MTNTSDGESPPDLPSSEDRSWAMAAHLAPPLLNIILGSLFWFTGGFGGVFVALVIYVIKKDEAGFAADAAKESLNFQITVALAGIVGMVMVLTVILACVALPLLIVIWLAALVLSIVAAVQVNKGVRYRYPFCLRLLK